MSTDYGTLVSKVWNYAHVLRDQGIGYGDYVERVVSLIDNETWIGIGVDVKGAIYEGLLEKNAAEVKSCAA